jgi:hypothetical protein
MGSSKYITHINKQRKQKAILKTSPDINHLRLCPSKKIVLVGPSSSYSFGDLWYVLIYLLLLR